MNKISLEFLGLSLLSRVFCTLRFVILRLDRGIQNALKRLDSRLGE